MSRTIRFSPHRFVDSRHKVQYKRLVIVNEGYTIALNTISLFQPTQLFPQGTLRRSLTRMLNHIIFDYRYLLLSSFNTGLTNPYTFICYHKLILNQGLSYDMCQTYSQIRVFAVQFDQILDEKSFEPQSKKYDVSQVMLTLKKIKPNQYDLVWFYFLRNIIVIFYYQQCFQSHFIKQC